MKYFQPIHLWQAIHKTIIVTTSSLGFLINSSKPVDANLSVSPSYLRLEAKKTQTTGFLSVGNTGNTSIRIRVSTVAFSYDQKGVFEEVDSCLLYTSPSPRDS